MMETSGVPPTSAMRRADPSSERERAKAGVWSLEGLIIRWANLADDLVLLGEQDRRELELAENEMVEVLERHRSLTDPILRHLSPGTRVGSVGRETLLDEHERFAYSLQALHELIEVVRTDGHGGNRQALGQYWRLVWEALRVHGEDEDIGLALRPEE
jgi:hypothetical protein